ncbi:MAG: lysylphosphatidylglycerol synthase transmembrane domain-containing protein [Polyangiaceae bacterium]
MTLQTRVNSVAPSLQSALTKRRGATALAVLVSVGLLGLVISRINVSTALARASQIDTRWLVGAAICSAIVLLARGARMSVLVPHAGFAVTLAAVSQQQFLNRVTPLRLGELVLPYLLTRHSGEDALRGLVHVVVIRLIDLALLVIAIIASVALREGSSTPTRQAALYGLLFVSIAGLFALRPLVLAARRVVPALATRLGKGEHPRVLKLTDSLDRLLAGGLSLSGAQKAKTTLLSLVVLVAQTSLFGAILLAFGVSLDPVSLLQGSCVAQVGAAIPVGSVGTVGTQEASWVAGFSWVGVSLDDAIVTGIACQVLTLLFAAVFAGCGALFLSRLPTSAPER